MLKTNQRNYLELLQVFQSSYKSLLEFVNIAYEHLRNHFLKGALEIDRLDMSFHSAMTKSSDGCAELILDYSPLSN